MKKYISYIVLLVAVLSGCETTLNETQSGALAGSALGAGLGAIIGEQTGKAGAGTAIGAGAGALAGGLIGEGIRRSKRSQQPSAYYQQPVAYTSSVQVGQVHTKFCPTDGKTYPDTINFCPHDGTELNTIQ